MVGASDDRSKFGNKVFRCYQEHGYSVTPINKKSTEIEGIPCVPTLTELSKILSNEIGVSIITPPGVTKLILEEGISLGITNFYLQPGTYDDSTDEYIKNIKSDSTNNINIVKSCVLIELGFSDQ